MAMLLKGLNLLQIFAEGGDGSAGGEGAGATTGVTSEDAAPNGRKSSLENVVYGIQGNSESEGEAPADSQNAADSKEPEIQVTANTQIDKNAEFEKLIKGDYKDVFNNRIQQIINGRFKETAGLKEQLGKVNPVIDILAQKYGVDAKDVDKLVKAVEDDDTYWEQEAEERGLTAKQLKEMKRLERENAEYKRATEEVERKRSAEAAMQKWFTEGEELKSVYPGFDLKSEAANGDFIGLLKAGVDVKTAYEVVHKDEILGGAMQYAAKQATAKMADGLQKKASRPAENGTNNAAAVTIKKDVGSLTKADMKEIERRVLAGEKIRF